MRSVVRGVILCVALGLLAGLARAETTVKVEDRKSKEVYLALSAEVRPTDPFHDLNAPAQPGSMKGVFPGDTFTVVVTGTLGKGWHTYPITQASEQQAGNVIELELEKHPSFSIVWPVQESKPEFMREETGEIVLEHAKPFTWSIEVYVDPKAKPGPTEFQLAFNGQVCSSGEGGTCIPFRPLTLTIPVTILDEPAIQPTAALTQRLAVKDAPPPQVIPTPPDFGKEPVAPNPVAGDKPDVVKPAAGFDLNGLFAFMLQGVFFGAVSLITPCVFPMIPITVSFFLHQAETNKQSALKLATVYTLTVVIVLTIAAVALLSVFRELSTWWVTNALLGGLFIYFALSLFGMYDIELPGWLSNFTSSREQQGGIVGTIFMALTFTIISFACVAPFLGGFGGTAASSGLTFWHRLAGGFAFAATFASPFFFLALFPSLLKRLPKSGAWMNSVKVVMGFLELAAAFAFLRQAEVAYHTPIFFTYELVLGVYVAICFLCGLYLLGAYNLPHDTPTKTITVPSLMLSFAFLGLGLYLMPGLFKTYNARGERTYPGGKVFAWIDSFILPDTSEEPPPLVRGQTGAQAAPEQWRANLRAALAHAQKTGQNVFVDFTGVTCKNCKLNERNVFTREDVRALLSQFVLVQLYTDRVPDPFYVPDDMGEKKNSTADAQKLNLPYEREVFNTESLPTYVILKPDGEQTPERVGAYRGAHWLPERGFQKLGQYEGLIQDVEGFKALLAKHAKKP